MLLRDQLEHWTALDYHLSSWILDCLTSRTHDVRAPGGLQCGLGSFSLQSSTLQTSCTSLTTTTCNDYVIVCLITDQDDREDRELTRDFVEWTLGLRTAWVFNLTINWTGQTTPNALYKRGQSRLYLLRTLMALVLTLFCRAIY